MSCDANDPLSTIPTEISEQSTIANISSGVSLIVEKASYLNGEGIKFQVVNNSEQTIYYNYGCDWPNAYKLEADERIGLMVFIAEVYPPTKQISPGESHFCFWDQTAWQDPSQPGILRFKSYMISEFVPSGQYELGFFYYLEEEEVDNGGQEISIWSEPFEIE